MENKKELSTEPKIDAAPGKLTFNDMDSVLDMGTNKSSEINAPKTVERLEKISTERHEQRKLDELEEEDYDSDSKTYEDDRNAPNYLERPPLSNTPSPDLIYERETTDEGENSKGEKILNRISSLDKREVDNKGLERLSSIENDKDEGEDEEDGQGSGDKKKNSLSFIF